MRLLLCLVVALAGCDLYETACETHEGFPPELRDPSTGLCRQFWPHIYCPDECGPCYEVGPPQPPPPWGDCTSSCTGLSEQACLEAPGCQAAYSEDARLQDAPSITTFTGCWAVAPSSSLPDSTCWARDAFTCAIDDTCAAYYSDDGSALTDPSFVRCAPEPAANGCENVDCGFGARCELQCAPCADPAQACPCAPTCVPDGGACAAIDCAPGYTCVETCGGSPPTTSGATAPWQCEAACVWTGGGDPGACTGDVSCFANPPACPTGTVPGIAAGCWTGYCIPLAACGPSDPGGCEPATCATPGPACPAGTVGGTANGCWTGYCIPEAACPVAACEQLTTEAACSARGDCQPIYIGDVCTCDPGCTCEVRTYDRCSSGVMAF